MRRWKIEKMMLVDTGMRKVKRHKKYIDKWIGIQTDVLKTKKYRESQRRKLMSWNDWLEWMEFGE